MRLTDVIGMLVGVLTDWDKVLINPQFIRKDDTITWKNEQRLFLDDPIRHSAFLQLVEMRQYTFQVLEDGAIFQIYYAFDADHRTLREASLSFFRPSERAPDYANRFREEDSTSGESTITWLRLDYHPRMARGVLHSDAHLHLGGFPDTRFAVKGVPTPKQFVEFVMASCYSKLYATCRLDQHGRYNNSVDLREENCPDYFCQDEQIFEMIPHIVIPGF